MAAVVGRDHYGDIIFAASSLLRHVSSLLGKAEAALLAVGGLLFCIFEGDSEVVISFILGNSAAREIARLLTMPPSPS